ncbi:hypothetical protein LJR225_005005 [Phenylobacterium sp. LjRoot225]|uniref:CC_3452 family protein n=1 Tax=Phenylobacterium sp. LjRoot225 TaxID=3342285 RepID=UPI003ED0AEF9
MKLKITLAAAAAIFSIASGAMAEPVVAKLTASTSGAVKPVAGGAVFECLGDVCASRAPSSDTASIRGCKELARQVGGVTNFGPPSKPLTSEQLSSCNESARK